MANYATDADLEQIVPDIFDHGLSTFEYELGESTLDVQRKIKGSWWVSSGRDPSAFDETLLVATEWKRATVYYALSQYILPKLANFSEDDTFMNMISFYEGRFTEEFDSVIAAGISYDFDEDGIIEETEITRIQQKRLYR